jgi:U2 small nuclear ribonucleoprotein A'
MRLSAEILSQSEQRTNPLGEREILMRGISIPQIEHLAVTRDQFDAMDFTDNLITKLSNFPKLQRLCTLSMAGNVIDNVDVKNLKRNLPNLQHLNLQENKIGGLHVISAIGEGCPKLETLVLVGNAVTSKLEAKV